MVQTVSVANPIHLDLDNAKPIQVSEATSAPRPKPKLFRNWTNFDPHQQRRFLAAQKKLGLRGPALLSMIFNEYADREGIK